MPSDLEFEQSPLTRSKIKANLRLMSALEQDRGPAINMNAVYTRQRYVVLQCLRKINITGRPSLSHQRECCNC